MTYSIIIKDGQVTLPALFLDYFTTTSRFAETVSQYSTLVFVIFRNSFRHISQKRAIYYW